MKRVLLSIVYLIHYRSPPVRGRGLKLRCSLRPAPWGWVAPRAGAWIETLPPRRGVTPHDVAPRAGAWIETRMFRKALLAK